MREVESFTGIIEGESEGFDNDPTLCNDCDHQAQWPKCMLDIKMRGYHDIGDFFDVTKCKNYSNQNYLNGIDRHLR